MFDSKTIKMYFFLYLGNWIKCFYSVILKYLLSFSFLILFWFAFCCFVFLIFIIWLFFIHYLSYMVFFLIDNHFTYFCMFRVWNFGLLWYLLAWFFMFDNYFVCMFWSLKIVICIKFCFYFVINDLNIYVVVILFFIYF